MFSQAAWQRNKQKFCKIPASFIKEKISQVSKSGKRKTFSNIKQYNQEI
jgi:hypothetical protein